MEEGIWKPRNVKDSGLHPKLREMCGPESPLGLRREDSPVDAFFSQVKLPAVTD